MRTTTARTVLFLAPLILAPSLPAFAAEPAEEWFPYPYASGCYGGELCGGNGEGAVVRLAPRPVMAIRFYAHDEVGETRRGRLRVRIDHHLLARELQISRQGAVIELDGVGLSGRDLHIEALGDEEVVVEDPEVRYAPPVPQKSVGDPDAAASTATPP